MEGQLSYRGRSKIMSQRVAVIIANCSGRSCLEKGLPTVFAQTYPDYEVVIVDNASTDGSVEWIQSEYPQARLIINNQNLGFSKASNQGILATTAPYIATLNYDTHVDPAWLSKLVDAVATDPAIGMGAPKILCAQPPHLIDSLGIEVDRAGFAWNRHNGQADDSEEHQHYEVFGPSAAAALYRREMLDDVGLFDESFFAYYEDVDLAWRACLAGWRCLYIPTARVYHANFAVLGDASPLRAYLLARNRIWTIAKNYPSPEVLRSLPLILIYDVLSLAYRFRSGAGWSSLRGRLAALISLSRKLKKRQHGQGAATPTERAVAWQHMAPPRNLIDVFHRANKLRTYLAKSGQ
jgi:GT2 family glycosyltransferase